MHLVAFQTKKYLQILMRNMNAGPSLAIDLYKIPDGL